MVRGSRLVRVLKSCTVCVGPALHDNASYLAPPNATCMEIALYALLPHIGTKLLYP
jgi:hypothetical protein